MDGLECSGGYHDYCFLNFVSGMWCFLRVINIHAAKASGSFISESVSKMRGTSLRMTWSAMLLHVNIEFDCTSGLTLIRIYVHLYSINADMCYCDTVLPDDYFLIRCCQATTCEFLLHGVFLSTYLQPDRSTAICTSTSLRNKTLLMTVPMSDTWCS